MSKPAIAIDARLVGGHNTGDSTYWTGLLHGLSRIETPFSFLLISNASKPSGIPDSPDFRWIRLPARSSRWWSLVSFPLAARKHGVRAVHVQYNLSPLVGKGGITTVHDVSFFIGPEWFKARDLALMRRFVPSSCRRAERVITVSQTSRSEIERYIPAAAGKVRVTYNACPTWIHQAPPEEADAVLRKLGIQRPFLLTVGTKWPRKNTKLAVDAVEALPKEMPHCLVLTGKTGWGEEGSGSRTQSPGYVSNEELSVLYSSADLYLAPSRHEGFGIPLLESFKCGCPVLCSSGGAFPEVAGDAAVVLQNWEPEAWSAAILELLNDSSKLAELRERGYRREAQFSWEETARRTVEVYQEVVK